MNPTVIFGLAGFLLAAFASCVNSIAFGISLLYFLKMATWGAALYLGMAFGRKGAAREIFPSLLLMSGLGLCAIAYGFLTAGGRGYGSMASTFYQSDVFAGYLLLVIPVAASFSVFSEDPLHSALYAAASCLLISSLILTNSRGAMVVFCLVFPVWSAMIRRKKPRALKSMIGFLFLAVFCGGVYLLASRDTSLLKGFLGKAGTPASWFSASHARFSFWSGGLRIFGSHPWLGSGLDTFGRLFPMVQEKFFWYSKYPHNFYIQTLSDGGLLTFAAVAGLLLLVVRSGLRVIRQDGKWFPLGFGLFFGFLGGALHLFLDVDSNFLMWSVLFWAIGGVLVALDSEREFVRPAGMRWKMIGPCVCLVLLSLQAAYAISSALDAQAGRWAGQGKPFEGVQSEIAAIGFFPWNSTLFEHRAQQEILLYGFTDRKDWRDKAFRDLKHALQIDPVRPLYLGDLAGLLASSMGRPGEAEALLERAIMLDPLNYPLHYIQLADLRLKEGKISEAGMIYKDVIRRYPAEDIARLPPFREDDFRTAITLAKTGLAKIHEH